MITTVVLIMLMTTVVTGVQVPAQSLRPAIFDAVHRAAMAGQQPGTETLSILVSKAAEDVRKC